MKLLLNYTVKLGKYDGDLIAKSFELAKEAGCQEFIDKNKPE